MKKRHFIIDAYNFINADESLRNELKGGNSKTMAKICQRIIKKLRLYSNHNNIDITLVFDGDNIGIGNGGFQPDLIFSGRYINADIMIKKMLDRIEVKQGTTVISSDREIISYSRLSGFESISSDDFLIMLNMSDHNDPVAEFDLEEYADNPIIKRYKAQAKISELTSKKTEDKLNQTQRKSKPKGETSRTQKYSGTEFYGGFNSQLDEEELSDLINDYGRHRSIKKASGIGKVYHTDQDKSGQTKENKENSESPANESKQNEKREKNKEMKQNIAKSKNQKMKSIDLSDLKKHIGNNN